ncbi:MAG: prolyl oligopeptidase family serine peptidase, partial [Mycobacterium sp.]|nr:prolyl oligopeptidase family serine peptidase [Mycobacterium sp.]
QAIDIDSLMAVELRVLLHKHLGISVPAMRLQRNLTVEGLSDLLLTELAHTDSSAAGAADMLTVHEITCADGLVCYGHLSLPTGPGPHPAVVVCPPAAGGALDSDGNYAHISEHAPLRAAGFAVFTVDRRGAPGHGAEYQTPRAFLAGGGDIDDADDIAAAADYLAGLGQIDADRISILGTSRGAFTALLALERGPRRWRSGVLLMGVYDLAALDITEPLRALLPEHYDQAAFEAYVTAPHRQPLADLTAIGAPILLVHGDADRLVPLQQSLDLADRLQQARAQGRLITVAGLGHDSEHLEQVWNDLWPQITGFLASDRQ